MGDVRKVCEVIILFAVHGAQESACEAADMGLIDYAVLEVVIEGGVALPVETIIHNDAFGQEGIVSFP
jgi:hypothetical protein